MNTLYPDFQFKTMRFRFLYLPFWSLRFSRWSNKQYIMFPLCWFLLSNVIAQKLCAASQGMNLWVRCKHSCRNYLVWPKNNTVNYPNTSAALCSLPFKAHRKTPIGTPTFLSWCLLLFFALFMGGCNGRITLPFVREVTTLLKAMFRDRAISFRTTWTRSKPRYAGVVCGYNSVASSETGALSTCRPSTKNYLVGQEIQL